MTIFEPRKDFRAFESETGIQSLTEVFALYLADYQDISVRVAGQRIDPKAVIATRRAFPLADIVADSVAHAVRLEIVEWRGISQRALFLCNEKRFPLSASGACSPKNCSRPSRCACCSASRKRRRNNRESTRTGRKNPRRQVIQCSPSRATPPPGTMPWTCG